MVQVSLGRIGLDGEQHVVDELLQERLVERLGVTTARVKTTEPAMSENSGVTRASAESSPRATARAISTS